MPFTDQQKTMIAKCKRTGYGWAKYAASVEASGRCSPLQEATLRSMVNRIDLIQERARRIHQSGWVGTDWDGCSLDPASAGYETNDY